MGRRGAVEQPKKEVPTVVAQDNKPAEREAKESIFKHHLGPFFGELTLDAIDVGTNNRFRATLLEKKLSKKRINNILAVLSKALATRMTSS